jgi:hypothetical protein
MEEKRVALGKAGLSAPKRGELNVRGNFLRTTANLGYA